MDPERLWRAFQERMAERLGPQNFELWFRPIKLLHLGEGRLALEVPNRFFKGWVEEQYVPIMQDVLFGMTGREYSILVRCPASEELPPRVPAEPPLREHNLNPRYTFEGFVVGPCNQFAHAACMAVADHPGERYNPLFIYGGVGLGKTHLLNAIGHRVLSHDPFCRVYYLTTEKFTNELINSIRCGTVSSFRERFRNVDLLLLDDIHFISGKERTQEEFFHTFNALYESKRQIVIASDRFPKEIPKLEERLRSRFESGLIADIQPPDTETKVAILRKKAEIEGIPLPDDVAYFLASCVESNIRELEGLLIRLGAFSALTKTEITLELAQEVLRDLVKRPEVDIDAIQRVVATYFHLKPSDLRSNRRTKELVHPRQVAMYLARKITRASYPEIGRHFGKKDHTTVMYSVRKVEEELKHNPALRKTIRTLESMLGH